MTNRNTRVDESYFAFSFTISTSSSSSSLEAASFFSHSPVLADLSSPSPPPYIHLSTHTHSLALHIHCADRHSLSLSLPSLRPDSFFHSFFPSLYLLYCFAFFSYLSGTLEKRCLPTFFGCSFLFTLFLLHWIWCPAALPTDGKCLLHTSISV